MSIALWCVLVAAVLPIVWVGFAKAKGPAYDNANPRGWAAGITGWQQRAWFAHQNAYEAFPMFAAAVIVSEIAGGAGATANTLALVFIAARLAHGVTYIGNWPTARSLAWIAGFFAAVMIFLTPLMA